MQDLSFDFKNPVFNFGGYWFDVMVYTFENAYGLDENELSVETSGKDMYILCNGLTWAGGQEKAKGTVEIKAACFDSNLKIDVSANCENVIRCVKVTLHGDFNGKIINKIDTTPVEINSDGVSLKYPEGWRELATPLVIVEQESGYVYFRSDDTKVRDKRFVFIEKNKKVSVELIFEESATCMSNSVTVPTWEIGYTDTPAEIYEKHNAHIIKSYNLTPWEKRGDVPDWMKEISLVASIHCQHWTGYIFNTYDDVLENLRWLCQHIQSKRILAYLPGWEGRYYWKYGSYCPDERMGGEDGFKRLCDGAKELGVRLMPMFGINIVNCSIENYEQWGRPCEFISPSGNIYTGSVDWDASRHYDHGSNRNLNPAAPGWQNRLATQIRTLAEQYGFDAAFLDIAAVWNNDPNHELYNGVIELCRKIKGGDKEFLVSGEAWYDGLSAVMPLFQSGHTDGVIHWHDEANSATFDCCNRAFAHLCLGDPSRLSTGVHELGNNPIWKTPLRKGIIPTVTIVDGTIENARDRVLEIVKQAKEYAKEYLND